MFGSPFAVLRNGFRVLFHHLPPMSLKPRELPSCSLGSVRAFALGGGLCDAPEGGLGAYEPALAGLLQLAVPCREGDESVGACHRCVGSQRLRLVDEESDGDSGVCVGVYQEGGLDVLDRPQGCVLPNSCPSGVLAVSSVLSREGVPSETRLDSLSEGGDFLPASSVVASSYVAAVVGPHGFAGGFFSLEVAYTCIRCSGASTTTGPTW